MVLLNEKQCVEHDRLSESDGQKYLIDGEKVTHVAIDSEISTIL